tara:strand:+ start:1189 stop:1659 length:471 start_codon:yes stop_codon:yes gene_type:complete
MIISSDFFRYTIIILFFVTLFSSLKTSYANEPEKIISYRKVLMKVTASHISAIASISRSDISYTSHVSTHANAIAEIARIMPDTFPEGTFIGKTRAKEAIWSDWEKFLQMASDLEQAARELAEKSNSSLKVDLSAGLSAIGATCSNCHKLYRKPAR